MKKIMLQLCENTAGVVSFIKFSILKAVYASLSYSDTGNMPYPTAIAFSNDGTKMYLCGSSNIVYELLLSTPWNISTAGINSTNSVGSAIYDIAFNSDGSKMYLALYNTSRINEYALSTPFNLSTATYSTFASVSQSANPQAMAFNTVGTKLYVSNSSGTIYEYTLSTPFSISTLSYSGVSTNIQTKTGTAITTNFKFSPDGMLMFAGVGNTNVEQYSLSAAFDLSTITHTKTLTGLSQPNNIYGIWFSPDGAKMYLLSNTVQAVHQYTTNDIFAGAIFGTVTKTTTPADLKKHGNGKWEQTATAAGSGVLYEILSTKTSVPTMTSNTLPSGTASSGNYNSASTLAFKAFDGDTGTYWMSNYLAPLTYLQYQFASGKIIKEYSLRAFLSGGYEAYAPKSWAFKGSNDGAAWTTLDTQTNVPAWSVNEERYYEIKNSTSYTYYRIDITATWDTNNYYSVVSEFKLVEALKTGLTSTADLSDIDPLTYLSIKERWALSRLSASDASPTVSRPSVTWEGSSNDWEDITDVALVDDNAAQLDFSQVSFSRYKLVRLTVVSGRAYKVGAIGSADMTVRINDLTSGYKRRIAKLYDTWAAAFAVSSILIDHALPESCFATQIMLFVNTGGLVTYKVWAQCHDTASADIWGETIDGISAAVSLSKISLICGTGYYFKTGSKFKLEGMR